MSVQKEKSIGKTSGIMASVVILTCNHERYISEAITSVLDQETDFDFEILIGDDASEDDTLKIVKDFQRRYPSIIRIVEHSENVGASRNAYDTMKVSRGKYLASCEGDDYWIYRKKLQEQVDFLEANTRYAGCVHPVEMVDINGVPVPHDRISWISGKQTFTLKDFRGIILPGHSASLVRTNLFLEPDFDPTIIYEAEHHIADRTQILIWLTRGDFYQMNRKMACHRVVKHGKNLTSTLYFDNKDRIRRDYEYTLRLERYAKEELNIDAGFDYHKRELFTKALVLHAIHPKIYDLSVARDILDNAEDKAWYWKGIIPVAAERIAQKTGLRK